MGKRGTKPTPTPLRLLRGNPSRRPLPENEPQPLPLQNPRAPKNLDAVGRAKWDELVPQLRTAGILTEIDIDALNLYCDAWARWTKARDQIKANGATQLTENGFEVASPHVAFLNRAHDDLRRLAAEFGMTPSSRSNVSATPPKPSDKDKEFFG